MDVVVKRDGMDIAKKVQIQKWGGAQVGAGIRVGGWGDKSGEREEGKITYLQSSLVAAKEDT